MTKPGKINPEDVYRPSQLATLRLKYTEDQIQHLAKTFHDWSEEYEPLDDLSSRWAYEWPGEGEEGAL